MIPLYFYSKCSIFLICHIRKIGLYHSGDSIVGNQNIGLFIGLCFYFIKKIIDSLCQPECGFSAFMTACKKLLCFLEILPIPGSGLPFSKILLNQPWFHPVWNSCHFRNQPSSIRCPAKRRAEDFICLNPLCKNLLSRLLCLLASIFCKRTVCSPANFVLNIPHGLPVSDKIEMSHGGSLPLFSSHNPGYISR